MRRIEASIITNLVAEMCQEANIFLGEDVVNAIKKASSEEESTAGKKVLKQIEENIEIARDERIALCQDTGFAVFYIEWGQEVHLTGGSLEDAINAGVRKGYREGYLRNSIVADPLDRVNTGDNTPAVIHTSIVTGDEVKITFAPKGGGSENMSAFKMLKPSDGVEGVIDFVVNHVKESGSNPCPPIVVGVGIGGTFEKAAAIAKKALLRPMEQSHPKPFYAELERNILKRVNNLGIGPQGFGGRVTALAVHIETFPAHIASLPVAVNINCHASRHVERTI